MKIIIMHIISILFLSGTLTAQESGSLFYVNDILGISFKYDPMDETSLEYGEEDPRLNLSNWKTYHSDEHKLKFKYPARFSVKQEESDYFGGRKELHIGFSNPELEDVFYPYVMIYNDIRDFFSIVKSWGFEFSSDSVSAFQMFDGFETRATKIVGNDVKGFRIGCYTRYYSEKVGRSIYINENESLLVIETGNEEIGNIVLHYTDAFNHILGEKRFHDIEFSEHEFYLIVSTININ